MALQLKEFEFDYNNPDHIKLTDIFDKIIMYINKDISQTERIEQYKNMYIKSIDKLFVATEKIIEIILNILKEINNKFHLISEKIISDTLSSTHYIGDSNDIIIKFFKDNGYKIKTVFFGLYIIHSS